MQVHFTDVRLNFIEIGLVYVTVL